MHYWSRFVTGLLLLLAVAGCGGSANIPIQGTVTLDGQPVEGPATIIFYPEAGTESPSASGDIVGGKYEIPADKGPSAGAFRVEITWPKPTGKKIASVDPGMPAEEIAEAIPAKYNKDSELKVEIDSGKTEHNFDLKSK